MTDTLQPPCITLCVN